MEKQNKTVNIIVVLNNHCNVALLFFKQQYAYNTIQEQDLKNNGLKEYLCFILPKMKNCFWPYTQIHGAVLETNFFSQLSWDW